MKKGLFTFAIIMLLVVFSSNANAQFYCFWVANQSGESFNELRIRQNGTGNPFSRDLLPSDFIESGKHFWVKTGTDETELWDVQITKMDDSPLLFTYKDRAGVWHRSQRFITVNAKDLHTLVIQNDEDGYLTFKYYTTDQLDFGHPCDN